MNNLNLNEKIVNKGKEIFNIIHDEKPALFNKNAWMGKIMDWSMKNENFKVQMFRFVDVFPSLSTGKMLSDHLREYFGEEKDMPPVLSWGARAAGMLGSLGGTILNKAISLNIQEMASQFIVGENTKEAVKNLEKLRKDGFAFVVDVLGEATLTDSEAEMYVLTYLELLDNLNNSKRNWPALKNQTSDKEKENMDWGHAPKINIAVKPTALYSQTDPISFESSVVAILNRMRRICKRVVEVGGFLCIDMESYKVKDITLEVFRRLKLEFAEYPHIGIVLQAYLKDTDKDLQDLLKWARQNNLKISIRLVKGAYWDYETVKARQNGWDVPVWTIKSDSDAAFERHAHLILENNEICHFACASHNIRTISAVMEMALELKVPENRYEFQVLYGMAEPVRKGILKVAGRIRLYCPYGDMVPGMGYLVRRLLENTANESFLRQSFVDNAELDKLLEDPEVLATKLRNSQNGIEKLNTALIDNKAFVNHSLADFTRAENREAFPQAIALVRGSLGKTYPLFIGGKDVKTTVFVTSVNPSNPEEVVGKVCLAGIEEVKNAIEIANTAFISWRNVDATDRAAYLLKAAAIIKRRIFELSAWQVLEVGKQWDQAYADVAEAIDFLEYYSRQMILLSKNKKLGNAPGEQNNYFYEPKGVAAVIAPWNFPLAISVGMVSAAIVTGNTVVYKPSGITPVIGYQLVGIFREAGLPSGVFNFIPGQSSVMGDYLTDHPSISLIAFTGSMDVGLHIIERAAKVHPGQINVKKVICEMGGKNAIIIDDDADLDEAVPMVLYSAFAFQGQKCSACSRVIVLENIYEKFTDRLVKAAMVYKCGSAEDPSNNIGPVADSLALKKILEYISKGKLEGKLLFEGEIPSNNGFYVPMTILGDITPSHTLAQEEIFGPVLSVMKAKDFDQAIEWANSTRFALTGGIFSRSPQHLDCARKEFKVGNLYINRNITGALVERQPFGGSKMSGVGTKAGGPDYLLHFMDPRVVTENTMRRGFTPI